MKREEKGITLIALIVTIIILLILAGVTLSMVAGEQGILKRTENVVSKTNQSQIQEEIELAYQAMMMDTLIENWDNTQKAEQLEKALQKQDANAKVVEIDKTLLISYKGYEVSIDKNGKITIEDTSKGEQPDGKVTILTTGEGLDKVEIQVIASITEGTIEKIEPLNGAVLKTENSKENQIFEVSENGKFYFRIKANNGRTKIVASEEIDQILQVSQSLLEGISKINSSGIKKVKVAGKTAEGTQENATYLLNVIHHQGDLVLDGVKTVEGSVLGETEGQTSYAFGNENDVGGKTWDAENTVVLKVEGNLTVNENIMLTSVKNPDGYGGPKGMVIYCTGTLRNNGTISMTACGAKAVGENVYLWKNGEGSFEYVPANGGAGGLFTGNNGHNGQSGENGLARTTGGGGSGAAGGWKGEFFPGCGAEGTSFSGGTGGGAFYIRDDGRILTGGSPNGGAGGNSARIEGAAYMGGGAGNPGGIGRGGNGMNPSYNGQNGTGGLLILYADTIKNSTDILAKGSDGGATATVGGGSSGGGSINIFYKTSYRNEGIINVDGGIAAGAKRQRWSWRNRFHIGWKYWKRVL